MRSFSESKDGAGFGKGGLAVFLGVGIGFGLCVGPATPVSANPAGGAVRAGEILLQQHGNNFQVIQGTRMGIIDWDSFSIAEGETTRFVQPDARSATLNRVIGESLSRIDGRLFANGRVFLLNSNGIVIGRDGVVDVAGFTASTLDLSNEAFLAGGDLTFRGGSQAAVVNLGSISAFDGDLFLVAATVENAGSLRAPRGTVGLAAGNEVLIRESGSERVFVRGASGGTKGDGVVNRGTIEANVAELKAYGGNVYGMAVKNEGRVVATGVTREGGQIFLRAGGRRPGAPASGGGKVRSTGHLSATRSGETGKTEGGAIVVDAGPEGIAEVGGVVEAGSALGAGGDIVILGNSVDIFERSLILADGKSGGGAIRVGGGLGGENPELANAERVTVGSGSLLSADALGAGDGGSVIVFAGGTLEFRGKLSARGGSLSGRGGFAELSGQRELFVDSLIGQVDLSAGAGQAGTLLIDPIDIQILAGSGSGGVSGTTIYANDIADFLATSGSLTITTTTTGQMTGNGDITIDANAGIHWSSSNDLSLLADRDFVMTGGATIEASGDGAFAATAARSISLLTGSSIRTNEGDLTLSANWQETATSGNFTGVSISGATVAINGGGTLKIAGRGGDDTSGFQHGIRIEGLENAALVQGGAVGTTVIEGVTGNSAGGTNVGILAEGPMSLLTTRGSDLDLGGTAGAGTDSSGILLRSDAQVSTALYGGAIHLAGSALTGDNTGIVIESAGIASGVDSLTITGEGAGEGMAIESVAAAGSFGSNGNIILRSTGGDVAMAGVVFASGLLLHDATVAGETRFTLAHSGNNVATLAAGGTGSAGRVGSIDFQGGNGFEVGSVEGIAGIRATGGVVLFSSGSYQETVFVNETIDSLDGSVHLTGYGVTINDLVSAPSGDITVAIGSGNFYQSEGGIAAIHADLVHGGSLSFLGGSATGDTVTYSDYSASPVVFDFASLGGIENLIGTSFASDQFNGPALAGNYQFTGGDMFEVNGVTVSGFENVIGGSEDDLFSFQDGSYLTGTLDGGNGLANRISYAGFSSAATVNLETGVGSGVPSGFSNIQVFNGSSHADTVIGFQASSNYQFLSDGTFKVGGFEVGGFENLFAGSGNDTFAVAPGGGVSGLLHGGAGFDALTYENYGAPVFVNLGAANATGFSAIAGLERYLGSAFEDTFTGTSGDDTFTIHAANAGQVNGGSLFFSFEHLRGAEGADRFLFQNQAMVKSVDGGLGGDLLQIDDRDLGGTHTYTITGNRIRRNPDYVFSGIEGIRLLLGPGNDTVVTGDFGLVQSFDGGGGSDFLNLGPSVYLRDSPMPLGGSTIFHSGFEGPFPPDTPPGEVLQIQANNVPRPQQGIDFLVEDRFSPGEGAAMAGASLLQALSQQGGNAFSAVLAGQAVILQIDGQQYLVRAPASLDGTLTAPPAELIERLREQLRADGWAELADAIEFEGAMSLISSDGPFPVDLESAVPPDLLVLFGSSLALDAAGELFSALEMIAFVPVTADDGAVAIFAVVVPIDEGTRAILLEHLSEVAFREMGEALEL